MIERIEELERQVAAQGKRIIALERQITMLATGMGGNAASIAILIGRLEKSGEKNI